MIYLQKSKIALTLAVCSALSLQIAPSAHAMFDGAAIALPTDALATGNLLNGVGFSALRAEDKKRLKRLRERYLELNPRNVPDIKIYDMDTPLPGADLSQ